MKGNLSEKLRALYTQYKCLKAEGEAYAAATRLAQISHTIPTLRGDERTFWESQLHSQRFTQQQIREIEEEIKRDIAYINNVLTIGNKWETDEILLVLQNRVFIDLLFEYFEKFNYKSEKPDLESVDELIERIAKTSLNKAAFGSAISLMKKNWGVPLKSKWIDYALVNN